MGWVAGITGRYPLRALVPGKFTQLYSKVWVKQLVLYLYQLNLLAHAILENVSSEILGAHLSQTQSAS